MRVFRIFSACHGESCSWSSLVETSSLENIKETVAAVLVIVELLLSLLGCLISSSSLFNFKVLALKYRVSMHSMRIRIVRFIVTQVLLLKDHVFNGSFAGIAEFVIIEQRLSTARDNHLLKSFLLLVRAHILRILLILLLLWFLWLILLINLVF